MHVSPPARIAHLQPVETRDGFAAEGPRLLPLAGRYDVIVAGAGPAGIAAALAAARAGARTLLLEAQGCLGGVWTSGLLSIVLDANGKGGIMAELRERLNQRGALSSAAWLYDAEEMKLLLEELMQEAGVHCLLHTRVAAALQSDRRLSHVVVENKSGRRAYAGAIFVDATGDGDLAALAGCAFDLGHPKSGLTQPMTLMALVSGVPAGIGEPNLDDGLYLSKKTFRELLVSSGHTPSYSQPSLFPLTNGLACLMVHHAYERSGLNAADVTAATFDGRREVMTAVSRLRQHRPGWEKLRVVATAGHIGVREGRRIQGCYRLTAADLKAGRKFADAVCLVSFPVDVHALKKADGAGYHDGGVRSKPYEIPYRALVARDIDGLLLAGRCISGDFHAHASYRVTGNACATGEAAGRAAAFCAAQNRLPAQISWRDGHPRTGTTRTPKRLESSHSR